MKLGEIKLEALRLMFTNVNEDLIIEQIDNYKDDESYGSYLANMPGSINRCFSLIEEKRVLPQKSHYLNHLDGTVSGKYIRFMLDDVIDDFFDIVRVICESSNGEYIGDYEYYKEGNTLVLKYDTGANYIVVYSPKIERISSETSENTEINIPDGIACEIPYFIKGDLFRDDEPDEAQEARNWFEGNLGEKAMAPVNKTSAVQSIFSQTEW